MINNVKYVFGLDGLFGLNLVWIGLFDLNSDWIEFNLNLNWIWIEFNFNLDLTFGPDLT